ncbi:hypothetical protein [Streptomyces sp. NBC_00299]|uniref:hypothetical protein n=1 Tax=Streptomyces sp. NBC_00299 TaxID=2975705 RepID=UPI002E29F159|nr:hypothetical protein [Streptomyces sp. NBC_00299]
MDGVDAPGAMRLVVPRNVRALDPAPAMFDAMLTGWAGQQESRLLGRKTIAERVSMVRRFALFNGRIRGSGPRRTSRCTSPPICPGQSPLAHSTVRGQQSGLRMFCSFVDFAL